MSTAVKNDDFFDNVEPWADPVDPDVLLDELVNTVGRFVYCSDDTRVAVALYVVMTWFIDELAIVPYAVITAPEMRCGKSTLLDLMADLVYRPFLVAGCSNASLFRLIDSCEPTMLIDEVDTFLSGDQERIGMLNSGYKRKGGAVLRCEGDRHKPTRFKTFGAKVLCGIGGVAKTLLDRSIVLELSRKPQGHSMEDLHDLEPEAFKPLQSQLARFAMDYRAAFKAGRLNVVCPDGLHDRAKQCWKPLFIIADLAGGDWPVNARAAAVRLVKHSLPDDDDASGNRLLADIRAVFDSQKVDRISLQELVNALNADPEWPWCEYRFNGRKGFIVRDVGKLLRGYKIKAKPVRIYGGIHKGFKRSDFEQAFRDYLP